MESTREINRASTIGEGAVMVGKGKRTDAVAVVIHTQQKKNENVSAYNSMRV